MVEKKKKKYGSTIDKFGGHKCISKRKDISKGKASANTKGERGTRFRDVRGVGIEERN